MSRALAAEALGTALLLVAVVGSGIMAERLAGGSVGLALLANSLATGCALAVLIFALMPVSGAHFNPAVTLAMCLAGRLAWRRAPAYIGVQLIAAVAGVALAHAMFSLPFPVAGDTVRDGAGLWLSEGVASFGLVFVILAGLRHGAAAMPWLVGAYITGAYWFTASTAFANPAVTVARSLTDSFADIAPHGAPAFVAAQLLGAALAVGIGGWLLRPEPAAA